MKRTILLFALLLGTVFGQTQLGDDIDGEAIYDQSGYSVSLSSDGNRVAIGAYKNSGNGSSSGHVRVFELSSGSWSQLGSDIDGEAASDRSGNSVSLSSDGSRVAIGAYRNSGNGSSSGHVRVYNYNSTSWIQLGSDIDGEAAGDNSGTSVSLSYDGNRVAIGATNNGGNGSYSGHVRVYNYDGTNWSQLGSDIDGEAAWDESGTSVSLSSDGSRVAIGASGNDGNGSSSGHVRIYDWSGSSWVQADSDIDGEAASDNSGYSVSLSSDGSRVAIGAYLNDGTDTDAGHVRVYNYNGTSWSQLGSDIDGEAASDFSGASVSLSSDGSRVAIGAWGNGGNGSSSGHVRLYDWSGSSWGQAGSDIDGEAASDYSGRSVSLSSDGNRVGIGAYQNDGTNTGAGHVRVFEINIASTVAAAFSGTPVSGDAPLTVQFTDASTGSATAWSWDFGDGSAAVTTQNATHTYTAVGTYTVALTVTNATSSDVETKADYITVTAVAVDVVAAFSATPLTGDAPLEVQFTDASTGNPTSWIWDFDNDGTADATTQNPSYTFNAAGSYTVVLTVSDGTSSDTATKTDYITVNAAAQTGSWVSITSAASGDFRDVFFFGDIGWAVGDQSGKVFKTTDKGETWTDIRTDTDWLEIDEVWFTSSTMGFIVQNFGGYLSAPKTGKIKKTTDGGATWTLVFSITDYEFQDIAFADANNGWAVTRSHIYKTNDGGAVWTEQTATTTGYRKISIIDANNVHILTGPHLSQQTIIVKTTNGGTDWADVIVSGTTSEFLDVDFVSNTQAWASGWNGKIFKTTDGVNYTVTETGYSAGLNYLDFINDLQGITVSASGLILRTEDGGTTWTEDEITNDGLLGIFYIDDATAVAVGYNGTILKYTNGNSSGNSVTADFSADVTSGIAPLAVQFTDASTGSPTSWDWDFNSDGTTDATTQNPSYTFTDTGSYYVSLTVSNGTETDSETKADYITVTEPSEVQTLLEEGFEGTITGWTVYDNDGDDEEWGVYESLSAAHSGSRGIGVYYNAYGNDDWLITPQLTLLSGSTVTFSFWAHSYSSSYLEDFNVKLSTTGVEISDFTIVLDEVTDVPYEWEEYTYDLSNYEGQSVYLAIQCVSDNDYYLYADDFLVSGNKITNYAPVASDTSISTDEDTDYYGTLPGSDVDNDVLTFAVVDSSVNGTVTLSDASTGTYIYSPHAGFFGADSFIFSVSDGSLLDTGSVNITVNTVDDTTDTFTLLVPKDSAVITTLLPLLEWEAVFDLDLLDTVTYTLHYGDEIPELQSVSVDTATSFQISTPLIDNTTYYWKVIATNLSGATTENSGGYHSFTVNTQNEPPSNVSLISPDSVIVLTLEPEFHWTEAIDPDPDDSVHYELHWTKDGNDFVDSVLIDTNYAIPYSSLQDNSMYSWWVISLDRQYDLSLSDEAIFWTDLYPEPPLAFKTVFPVDSTEGLPTEVVFIWNKATDPDPIDNVSYTLIYATDFADSNTYEFIPVYEDTTVTLSLSNDTEYLWWIMANDEDGFFTSSNNGAINRFVVGTLSIEDELIPTEFSLHQNYPNPFNPITTLRYDLREQANVNIIIYDMLGRHVTTLVNQTQEAGFKSVIWNATNDHGKPVSAGVYIYQIRAGEFVQTKKMVLLK